MSSQVLFQVKASDINVLTSLLDISCANLVLLSPVNSEAFKCLSANLLIVRSHFHSIWGYLAIMNFLRDVFF